MFKGTKIILKPRIHFIIGKLFCRIILPGLPLGTDFPESVAKSVPVTVTKAAFLRIRLPIGKLLTVNEILETVPDFMSNHGTCRLAGRRGNPQGTNLIVIAGAGSHPVIRIKQVNL